MRKRLIWLSDATGTGGTPVVRGRFWLTVALGVLLCSPVFGGQLVNLKTAHYLVHTDLDIGLATELSQRMEAMYGEYSRRMEDFHSAATNERLEVYLFARKRGYDQLTENKAPNSGGIFMFGSRNLLAAYVEEQGRENLRRTLQHEAFHQFAYKCISENLPIWLNEGLAQLFEEGIWTGSEFQIGQIPPSRLRQLQQDIQSRRFLDFEKLFAMSTEEWGKRLARDVDSGTAQYNEAWAVVQFLGKTTTQNQKRLVAWLKAIHGGQEPLAAFDANFPEGAHQLQLKFMDWVRSLRPTELATVLEHQGVLADMLVSMHGKGKMPNDVIAFRTTAIDWHYRIRYQRGKVVWTTEADPTVYFCDLNGRMLGQDGLCFERDSGAPLPDLIRRESNGVNLRTRFYKEGKEIKSETFVEGR